MLVRCARDMIVVMRRYSDVGGSSSKRRWVCLYVNGCGKNQWLCEFADQRFIGSNVLTKPPSVWPRSSDLHDDKQRLYLPDVDVVQH